MSRFLFWLVVIGLHAALASAAFAQSEAPDAARDEEARSLFQAGRTAFLAGRFEDARTHFRHAYELSHRPALLYNIGTAEDRLRNDAEALAAFEAYLEAVPDAENRPEVEGRMTALRAALASRETVPVETGSSGPSVVWTWVAGGAALLTGGLAVGFWVLASDRYGELDRGCLALRGGCTAAEVDAAQLDTWVTLTNALLVSSLVLGALTAVTLTLELTATPASPSSPRASLRFGPGSLALVGAF